MSSIFIEQGRCLPSASTRQRRDAAAATILDTESAHAAADCYLSHFQMQRIRS